MNEHIAPNKEVKHMQRHGFNLEYRQGYYDRNIIKENIANENYKLPDKMEVMIDVGANIGIVSLLAARRGAKVYSFEPEKSNFDTLCNNVKLNGYEGQIIPVREGVGAPGEAKLYIDDIMSGGNSIYRENFKRLRQRETQFQTVKVISLKEVFERYNISHCDVLKLDCEGSEKDIIPEFNDDMASKIDQISVEFHHIGSVGEMVSYLSQWYIPECVVPRNRTWRFIRPKVLHIGSGGRYYPQFINSDMRSEWRGKAFPLDLVMDISKTWPYENESIDGIVSMHVLEQLYWRDLLFSIREAYRVLKKGGVMRFGCPTVDIKEFDLDYLLGWNNVNLFSSDLLKQVFEREGFTFQEQKYRHSVLRPLARADNRRKRGSRYFDVVKL